MDNRKYSAVPEIGRLTLQDIRNPDSDACPDIGAPTPPMPAGKEVLPNYTYQPLRSAKGAFRLLRIEKSDSDTISLNLVEYDLESAPEYCALSYTWGCPVNSPSPDVEDFYARAVPIVCNGSALDIGRNLFEALLQVAADSHDDDDDDDDPDANVQLVWADGICIDQGSVTEKNEQVAQMGDIYAGAATVLVWLGHDALYPELPDFLWLQRPDFREQIFELDEQARTMRVPGKNPLAPLIQFVNGREFPGDLNPAPRWPAYETFYNRCRWFERAWVVQEVVLAREIEMRCGEMRLDWNRLRSLSNFVRRHANIITGFNIAGKKRGRIDVGHHGKAMYSLRTLCINGGPEAIDVSSPHEGGYVFPRAIGGGYAASRLFAFMEYALSVVRPLAATQLQDKVYCIFGLLNRFLPPMMEPSIPDYSLDALSVFYSMASMLVQHAPQLSVLSAVQDKSTPVHPSLEKRPSWVPDYSVPLYSKRSIKVPLPDGKDVLHPYKIVYTVRNPGENHTGLTRGGTVEGPFLKIAGTILDEVVEVLPIPDLIGGMDSAAYIGGLLNLTSKTKSPYPDGTQCLLEILSRTLTLNRPDFNHLPKDDFMSPLQMFLVYFVAKAHISAERLHGHKGYVYFDESGHSVRNQGLWDKIEMLSSLEELAAREPRWWRDIDVMQKQVAPAMRTAEEARWLWTDHAPEDHGPEIVEKASSNTLGMILALQEAGSLHRALFLTRRGYLGMGMPSMDVGDEVWAFSGAAVPFLVRKFENPLFEGKRDLVGEAYLHGFMDGWKVLEDEGIPDGLVAVDLR